MLSEQTVALDKRKSELDKQAKGIYVITAG